ncbi:MAG: carboxypeptidase-like regulatory domain-containing protein [FCB group bacterium]|nr:carboxypeptidase-like regulatory domain-containing protein [FCB group bacterium]
MRKSVFCIFVFLIIGNALVFGQNSPKPRFVVEGIVYDESTGQPIPGATVQVVGSGIATPANADGRFRLVLEIGQYEIKVSHVGHYSTRFDVSLADTIALHDIRLKPLVIDMGERVVFSRAYDPAQKIIASAIARKRDILNRIHDYSSDAYMKLMVNDVSIPDSIRVFFITETQTTSYWQNPDKFKEIITARKQSANIPAEGNLVSLGEMTNFNRNRVDIGDYDVVSPVAVDALDHYNYYLLDTVFIDQKTVFVLEVEPKNKFEPLFVGEIHIADSTFDVVKVDVGFTTGVVMPFIKNARYYQQLAQIDGEYWLPVQIGFYADVDLNMPFPGIPKEMTFEYVASIYSYRIDRGLPSGLFDEYELEVDERADDLDSALWAARQTIPLTELELVGYQRIDSVKNAPKPLYKQLLKGMAAASFIFVVGVPELYHFNRVEGPYAGFGLRPDLLNHDLRLKVKAGYGFEDENWQYNLGFKYRIDEKQKIWLGASIKDKIEARPTLVTGANYNPTFFSFFFKIDPLDYYQEKGWDLSASLQPLRRVTLHAGYADYEQLSRPKQADHEIFRSSITRRENPPIADGRMRTLKARLEYDSRRLIKNKGRDMIGFDQEYLRLSAGIEYASPDLIDNDFDFRRYEIRLRATKKIFGLGLTKLTGFAGMADGELPPQRYFSVDFNNPDIFRERGFNTLSEENFGGDRAAGFYVDHSFGKYALRHSGISFLKGLPFGLSLHGGAFWSRFKNVDEYPGNEYIKTAKAGYSEIGFGLTNLTPFLMPLNLASRFTVQLSNHRTFNWMWLVDFQI